MPTDKPKKDAVRLLAKSKGLSYTQALRQYESSIQTPYVTLNPFGEVVNLTGPGHHNPYLLVNGRNGSGKTRFISDVAEGFKEKSLASICVGQHYGNSFPQCFNQTLFMNSDWCQAFQGCLDPVLMKRRGYELMGDEEMISFVIHLRNALEDLPFGRRVTNGNGSERLLISRILKDDSVWTVSDVLRHHSFGKRVIDNATYKKLFHYLKTVPAISLMVAVASETEILPDLINAENGTYIDVSLFMGHRQVESLDRLNDYAIEMTVISAIQVCNYSENIGMVAMDDIFLYSNRIGYDAVSHLRHAGAFSQKEDVLFIIATPIRKRIPEESIEIRRGFNLDRKEYWTS